MICQKCGRTNPEGAQLCNGCGGVTSALARITDIQTARSDAEQLGSSIGLFMLIACFALWGFFLRWLFNI